MLKQIEHKNIKDSIMSTVYDLIGVGCGPSNLSLSIALQEREKSQGSLSSLFLDKQKNYQWHGNTITSQSELQISFLKDLVSLRNPTSPYSFVNYLKTHDRLVDFINLGTFYPSRLEFNDYLSWVAKHFSDKFNYGEEVIAVEPIIADNNVEKLRVIAKDIYGKEFIRETRSLVLSLGGTPLIPKQFQQLKSDPRVFHYSTYLASIAKLPCSNGKPMRVAIIGGGQSAAEALLDLNDSYPSVKADMILRSMTLKPADSSPFVNEIFAPASTDDMFERKEQAERDRVLKEYHHTNYSVIDEPMIKQIYNILYKQKVSGVSRHNLYRSTNITNVTATDEYLALTLRNNVTGAQETQKYDAVILATGYERKQHLKLLAPMTEYIGDCRVDRNYRLQTDSRCKPAIYLQGNNQSTHGLSDTLLSVLSIRSDEIAASLYTHLTEKAGSNLSFSKDSDAILEII
jgi:L-ornithine N5-oxygenase